MPSGSVARRYARAIFDIGIERGTLADLVGDVERTRAVWDTSEELRVSLTNPRIKESDRRAIWAQTLEKLDISPASRNFFFLLFDKRRLEHLPAISRELVTFFDRRENRLRAEIVSAQPIDAPSLNRLQSALERRTGKTVLIAADTDPALIGGIVTRIGDLMIDGSIRTRLERVRETILEA